LPVNSTGPWAREAADLSDREAVMWDRSLPRLS
jgi:hypothetical protein